jgi:DNA primase
VVEGYMDVIALAQAGFAHAVAPLGTAIGDAQLAQLWQLADEPIICLDGDAAGLQAGHRLVERALPALKPGKSLRFALLPQGRDPDSVLRARSGTFPRAQALRLVLDEAVPLMEFLWHRETATRSPTVPQHRAALEQRYRALAASIPDRVLSRLLLDDFYKRLRTLSERVGARAASRPPLVAPPAGPGVGAARLASGIAKPEGVAERELVWPIVAHPQLLAEVEEEFAALELVEAEIAALRDAIVGWYGEQGHLDPSGLRDHLCQIGFASVIGQLAARGPAWCADGRDPGGVLEGWRALVTQRRRFAERRQVALAAEAAIAARRDREATEQVLAVDRLINPRAGAGARRSGVED